MKLSGAMINTEDSKKLSEFYTKVFGKPGWEENNMYGFDTGNSNIMIMPHSEVKGSSKEPARIMITFSSSDVQKDFDMVKEVGGKVVAEPYQPDKDNSPKVWLATIADPDGNYLQISTPWEDAK